MLLFDWDPPKELENIEKHGISFGAATAALEDIYAIEEFDQFVDGERRLVTTGMAEGETIILVTHVSEEFNNGEDELARIISARKASAGERRHYEQNRAASSWYPVD